MSKTTLYDPVNVDPSSDIHPTAFVAANASVVGSVAVGAQASIWFGSVCRGDIRAISIGQRSNIQDLTVIHVENDADCIIGNDVTVGHRALLHACTIEDAVLVGMGAIVLNGAHIESGAVIAAGAVIKEGTHVRAHTLWAGVPAKPVKTYQSDTIQQHREWAQKYVALAEKYRARRQSMHEGAA